MLGIDLDFLMEQAMGVEPTSSAWKADILAVVRRLHKMADCFNVLSALARCFYASLEDNEVPT